MHRPPIGITPPTPGLDREEPEFRTEEDIPEDDDAPPAARDSERGSRGHTERGERGERGKIERE